MKKYRITCIISLLILFCLSINSCTRSQKIIKDRSAMSREETPEQKENKVEKVSVDKKDKDKKKVNQRYPITLKGVFNYMTDHKFDNVECLSLEKSKLEKKYFNGEDMYFLFTKEYNFWSAYLYKVNVNGGEIQSIIAIAGGNEELFGYDVVSLSQGDFVSVYNASHMGNGALEYYSLNDLGDPVYSIGAVDAHFENMEMVAIKYGYSKEHGNGIRGSEKYKNGKLIPEYKDIDGDGNTDITLSGVKQVYIEDKLKKEFNVRYVYLYNADKDTFEESEKLGNEELIKRKSKNKITSSIT